MLIFLKLELSNCKLITVHSSPTIYRFKYLYRLLHMHLPLYKVDKLWSFQSNRVTLHVLCQTTFTTELSKSDQPNYLYKNVVLTFPLISGFFFTPFASQFKIQLGLKKKLHMQGVPSFGVYHQNKIKNQCVNVEEQKENNLDLLN